MQFGLVCILGLILVSAGVDGVKKKISPEVKLCKRNDPELQKCYCANFKTMTPLLANGNQQMNLLPIDPTKVENIKMDFTQTKSVKLVADLYEVQLGGISKAIPNICQVHRTEDGIQFYFELYIPHIILNSKFKALGNFLLLPINSIGDFEGEFSDLIIKTKWNSTRYDINGKEHLKFTNEMDDVQIDKLKIHFNNLFGDNTELNENINLTINENIVSIYGELKPFILETLSGITQGLVNDLFSTFSYDELFPLE